MTFMSRPASLCAVLLLTATAALAQPWQPAPSSAPAPAPSWGVTDESAITVSSFEMVPYGRGTVLDTQFGTSLRSIVAATQAEFQSGALPLDPPRGAIITRIEVEACNDAPSNTAGVGLYHFDTFDLTPPFLSLSIPANSGCGTFSSGVIAHEVAADGHYGLLWTQQVLGASQRLALVRVYYRLQVSPAPATATFADVPVGSALHQYVEALVAAGITSGCGGGNFCPNTAVTRGQIAVFLAKALGLHWAP